MDEITNTESIHWVVKNGELFETETMNQVWPVEVEDVLLARTLVDRHPGLGARDLLHLASCHRRDVRRIKTFDRGLGAAFGDGAV